MRHQINKVKFLIVAILVAAIGFGLYEILAPQQHAGISPGNDIDSLCFSNDDKYLAVASLNHFSNEDDLHWFFNGGIQIYDTKTLKLYKTVQTFHPPYNPLITVGAFYSLDGKQLVVNDANENGKSVVYELPSFEISKQKPSPYVAPDCVAWDNGSWAKITSINGKVTTVVKTPHHSSAVHTGEMPEHLALDAAHQKLAISNISGDVCIFDLNKWKITSRISCRPKSLRRGDVPDVIYSLVWLPRQQVLWIVNNQGRSVFWDSSLHKVKTDVVLPKVITCAAVNHAGNSVAFSTIDEEVQIVSLKHLLNAINSGRVAHLFK